MILICSSVWGCFLSLLFLLCIVFVRHKIQRDKGLDYLWETDVSLATPWVIWRRGLIPNVRETARTLLSPQKCKSKNCKDNVLETSQFISRRWKILLQDQKSSEDQMYFFFVRISCVQILAKCNIQILYILQAHLRPLESPATDKQTKLSSFPLNSFSLRSFFCIPTPFTFDLLFTFMFGSIETKYWS